MDTRSSNICQTPGQIEQCVKEKYIILKKQYTKKSESPKLSYKITKRNSNYSNVIAKNCKNIIKTFNVIIETRNKTNSKI